MKPKGVKNIEEARQILNGICPMCSKKKIEDKGPVKSFVGEKLSQHTRIFVCPECKIRWRMGQALAEQLERN